ncbi:methyltransferase domain-containing protein [Leptothrix discophora]|uniref:Methyltransferase domain-containing protein n=1 Tax=Leptothrix discophora TaxID=89 RepID=A0ABT9G0S1_LEPDI|nr:methyltransferase domain-containing protein [Leptothrix discophora]MDP4300088.1 methyltransferase domain-containing protein [Leptothrix discophora]
MAASNQRQDTKSREYQMHQSALQHARLFFQTYTEQDFSGQIIEIGSQDVNGSLRELAPAHARYLGLDFQPGKGVDLILQDPYALPLESDCADIVMSSSCLEHSEFFWLAFLEMVRIVRPGGLIYLNAPSNGMYHRYPVDCWRFYPDSGVALQEWARRNHQELNLLESFIGSHHAHNERWNDYVAVFQKVGADAPTWNRRMLDLSPRHYNARIQDDPQPRSERLYSEDQEKLLLRERQLDQLLDMIDRRTSLKQAAAFQAESRAQPPEQETVKPEPPSRHNLTYYRFKREFYRLLGRQDKVTKYAHKIREFKVESTLNSADIASDGTLTFGIMTTPHTMFVAHAIQAALKNYGIQSRIHGSDETVTFDLPIYFVLCPQIFKVLPPGERRIAYQFEQTVSERWMTPQYLDTLRESRAMIDYSLDNLNYFAERDIRYPHCHYLPVGSMPGYDPYGVGDGQDDAHREIDQDIELVFYGDSHVPRRRAILDELGRHFRLTELSNTFGAELHRVLRRARVVINLHYYENALLETTRINECLALGLQVVSESSSNQAEYPIESAEVRFVAPGDIDGMIREIKAALSAGRPDRSEVLRQSASTFQFLLGRILLAQRLIDFPTFERAQPEFRLPADRLCLSLPETVARRKLAEESRPLAAAFFDGIRMTPGWVGCGLSYKFMCRKALEQGLESIVICEDDALVSDEASAILADVQARHRQDPYSWDIFAGLIAHLHEDTEVCDVSWENGRQFVTIDRMTSMVCNIYGQRAMRIISNWNEADQDPQSNTIDRYLENYPGLRITTTLPFLAGHREDTTSVLWGFQNTQYSEMIQKSEALLKEKVEQFLARSA